MLHAVALNQAHEDKKRKVIDWDFDWEINGNLLEPQCNKFNILGIV